MLCAQCARKIAAGATECPDCAGDPLLDGRYRLDRQLTSDSFGVSYRATRVADGQLVRARSCLLRRLDSGFAERLEQLRDLVHPSLPRRLDEFTRGEGSLATLWLVDEYIAGHTLADAIAAAADRRVDAARVLTALRELAGLLVFLHRQPVAIVHGAIAPQSILMQPEDRGVVLLDLACASEAVHVSGTRGLAGSLEYAAPEQLYAAATPAADVWALAAVSVAALSGAPLSSLRDADASLRWRGAVEVDASFAAILERMLEPDPARRIGAAELVAALASVPQPKPRRPTHHPWTGQDTTTPARVAPRVPPRSPPKPKPKPKQPPRAGAEQRTRSGKTDVPVRRPEELSRELSQAQQAAVGIQEQQRSQMALARVLVVLLTAVIAALATYIALNLR